MYLVHQSQPGAVFNHRIAVPDGDPIIVWASGLPDVVLDIGHWRFAMDNADLVGQAADRITHALHQAVRHIAAVDDERASRTASRASGYAWEETVEVAGEPLTVEVRGGIPGTPAVVLHAQGHGGAAFYNVVELAAGRRALVGALRAAADAADWTVSDMWRRPFTARVLR